MHPQNLLLEHVGGAAPCARAASATSPPRVGEAALLGSGQWHLLGLGQRGGGTSSLPHLLDGSLDVMRLLEEGEALGFTSW
jgi:hypothetical protein